MGREDYQLRHVVVYRAVIEEYRAWVRQSGTDILSE